MSAYLKTFLSAATIVTGTAGSANAATHVYTKKTDGKCYKTETSFYTGKNKYEVNGKVRSFTVPDVSRFTREKDIKALKEARARKGKTPKKIRDAVAKKVAPRITAGFKKAVLFPLLKSQNVIGAAVTAKGNNGKTSVYEGMNISAKVGASFDLRGCKNVRSDNRRDGNQYGPRGFGKALSPKLHN